MPSDRTIRVATVNDYDLVVAGVAALLERYPSRFEVAGRVIVGEPITTRVDVALFDTFGRAAHANEALGWLCNQDQVAKVAVFSLSLAAAAVDEGRNLGVAGFISKALPADEIAEAIAAVADGEEVVAGPTDADRSADIPFWPGHAEGLTQRESEVLAMMARGYTNAEIAAALYIGTETVKTHVKRVFDKLKLRNRAQAGAYVGRSASFGPGNGRSVTPTPAD